MKDEYMRKWDEWRWYIAAGGGGSWPRDAFESIIDYLHELEAENCWLRLYKLNAILKEIEDVQIEGNHEESNR